MDSINQTFGDTTPLDFLRKAATYISRFHNNIFVIAVPDDVLELNYAQALFSDIHLLATLGIKVVVIYSSRKQINREYAKQGQQSKFHRQQRITPAADMPLVISATGYMRAAIEAMLTCRPQVDAPPSKQPPPVVSGNFVMAQPIGVIDGIDFDRTGTIRKIDTSGLHAILDKGAIVLIGSLGYSATGELLNLTSTEIAQAVACAMHADKLIYIGDIRDYVEKEIKELSANQAEQLAQQLPAEAAHILHMAYAAVNANINRVHLIPCYDGALLGELFSRQGVGVLVVKNSLTKLRKATLNDVGRLMALIDPLELSGKLLPRSRDTFENNIDRFWLSEYDQFLIGCAALEKYNAHQAELACLAISQDHQHAGHGDQLRLKIEQEAKTHGIHELFILTTQTRHWFEERGYKQTTLAHLPEPRRVRYDQYRNAQILVKTLN